MLNLLPKNILVIGDIMHDQYWQADCDRISPEAPVPVASVKTVIDKIGGAGNVALNAKSLGAVVKLIAVVGEDESANILKDKLQQSNIGCHLLADKNNHPTIKKLRIISTHNQQMIRLDFEETFANHPELQSAIAKELNWADMVVLSDYNKGTLHNTAELIAFFKQHNKLVVVDPKSNNFADYAGADIITPNKKELEQVIGTWCDYPDMVAKTKTMMNANNIAHILVTLSEHGMLLVDKDGNSTKFKSQALEVADVTGAGDTVVAALAYAWNNNKTSLNQAIEIANNAAAIVVGKSGSAVASIEEIAHKMQDWDVEKIIGFKSAGDIIKKLQSQNLKVVLTNGCFDLLHIGHVKYLREAKMLGDILVVAVNADETVTALKGKGRPVNNIKERLIMLSSLEMVDYVLAFSEETPHEVIKIVKPDILVKGGDYNSVSEVVGSEIVLEYGGEVKTLCLVQSQSTSATIERILDKNPLK